jgi:plasmid maintenance system antidote protein VapI
MATDAPITDVLREVIQESGIARYALSKATGVPRPSIVRFRRGDQSIRLDHADKIAAYFGLKLIKPAGGPRRDSHKGK